jgi:hypothetical protein
MYTVSGLLLALYVMFQPGVTFHTRVVGAIIAAGLLIAGSKKE